MAGIILLFSATEDISSSLFETFEKVEMSAKVEILDIPEICGKETTANVFSRRK